MGNLESTEGLDAGVPVKRRRNTIFGGKKKPSLKEKKQSIVGKLLHPHAKYKDGGHIVVTGRRRSSSLESKDAPLSTRTSVSSVGPRKRRSVIESLASGIGVIHRKSTSDVTAPVKPPERKRSSLFDSKRQTDLEEIILSRFDQEHSGHLTAMEIFRATRVLFRSAEQPTEEEIRNLLEATGSKNNKMLGIKISNFCDIWVQVIDKQNELSDRCTELAREIQHLEKRLQELVLGSNDRDDLLIIQEAFKFFRKAQEAGEAEHVSYLSMKRDLSQSFSSQFVNERKKLLATFLNIVTDLYRTKGEFEEAEETSAWSVVTKELRDRKTLSSLGKELLKSEPSLDVDTFE